MAQTASMDHLLQMARYANQRGMPIGQTVQVPIQVEAGSMRPPSTAASLSNVLKDVWTGDAMRLGLMPGRAPYSHIRSNRTRRTGLSYRQRQARGRAARVR